MLEGQQNNEINMKTENNMEQKSLTTNTVYRIFLQDVLKVDRRDEPTLSPWFSQDAKELAPLLLDGSCHRSFPISSFYISICFGFPFLCFNSVLHKL